MKRKLWILAMASLIGWVALLAGGATFQYEAFIRLGGTLSQSGNLAKVASLYADGRQLAVELINAQGGVKVGGTAYGLELVQSDDGSDAAQVTGRYEQLLSDGATEFLLGPYSSNLVLAASEVGERFHVPMVQGGGAASSIFGRGYRYVFGTLPSARDFFKDPIQLFKQEAGASTMALIYANDAFSKDVAVGARQWAQAVGLQIVLDEEYADGQTEFAALIERIKAAHPDVVMGANHLVEILAFVPQARDLGLEADLVLTGIVNPQFLALGQAVEGIFSVAPWVPSQATQGVLFGSAADYTAAFKTRFGYEPEYHNANGTIEVLTFKQAIEAAGSLGREAVRDALAALSYESFYGTVHFGENGQIDKSQTVIQIQNDAVVSVGPGGEAQAVYGAR